MRGEVILEDYSPKQQVWSIIDLMVYKKRAPPPDNGTVSSSAGIVNGT